MEYQVFGENLSLSQLKDRYGISANDVARCAARCGGAAGWIGYEIEALIYLRKGQNADVSGQGCDASTTLDGNGSSDEE